MMFRLRADTRRIDYTWILLVALTLGGIALGERGGSGFWLTLVIAAITAAKGRLVIDRFMELGDAHPGIRRLVRLWGLLVPGLVLVTWFYGPQIARLTRL